MKYLSIIFFLLIVGFYSCSEAQTESKASDDQNKDAVENKDIKSEGEDSAKVDTQIVVEEKEPKIVLEPKVEIHDSIANFLLGLTCKGFLTDSAVKAEYLTYNTEVKKDWEKIDTGRISSMNTWRVDYLNTKIDKNKPLYYPFSGPDFLHAYHFYPDAPSYVFFALEKIGDMPDFKKINDEKKLDYQKGCINFLADIFKRSYFITGYMDRDIHSINGVLPIFYLNLAKTGHEIIDVQRVTIDENGKIVERKAASGEIDGVKFRFRRAGVNESKELFYFSVNVTDDKLAGDNAEFVKYVQSIPESNTFVKSASYLMSYGTFSTIRDLTLDLSASVFQDDTGVAYRFFKNRGKYNWDIDYFGVYVKPISDFSGVFQNDLNQAYKDNAAKVQQLPFSLGYHWRLDEQNQILAIKKGPKE
jgi:hypothetical protein